VKVYESVRGDPEQLKLLTQDAANAFNARAYKVSLSRYQALYELEPAPIFLYMIAQCYRSLEQTEKAIAFYLLFVEKTPKDYLKHALAVQYVLRLTELKRSKEAAQLHSAPEKPLLVISAVSGAAGLTFGGLALLNANRLNNRTEFTSFSELKAAEIEVLDTKRKRAALLSDVMLGVSLVTGGTALLLKTKSKKAEKLVSAKLSLSERRHTLTSILDRRQQDEGKTSALDGSSLFLLFAHQNQSL
jgi:tetratricopeptide (TPR) repeat protein